MWSDQVETFKMTKPSGVSHLNCSLVPNAITCSPQFYCFPHTSDLVVTDLKNPTKNAVECKVLACQDKDKQLSIAQVMQVKFIKTGEHYVLVVGMNDCVQVWDPEEASKLASVTIPAPATPPPDRHHYARGFSLVKTGADESALIVGASTGTLHVIEVDKFRFVYKQALEGHHKQPIADVSSTHEPEYAEHTLAASVMFAAADEGGCITVWDAAQMLPTSEVKVPGECFTSLKIRGDRVLAATLTGKICIFSISQQRLQCEISAHARGINSIALHPYMDWVASVSEDTYLNIWNIEGLLTQEIEAVFSHSLKDHLLCGVSFVGEKGKDVIVSNYDSDTLSVFRGDPIPM